MTKINNCRICKSKKIKSLFSLGIQSYTGIFPKKNSYVPKGKLTLIICENCKLVQLDKNFDEKRMYGKNYGYRTSLNKSMQKHIEFKKNYLGKIIKLKKEDTIIDIGSNDGTFLNCYNSDKFKLIGVDPSLSKFKKFYKKNIIKISNFFLQENIESYLINKKAKLITTFAMFYDLQDPVKFTNDIYNCLDENGIWHFEQSYIVDMLKKNSYDTICHEHLEYYSITSIYYLMNITNFKIIDIRRNNINGGSIAITVAKKNSNYKECKKKIISYLTKEKKEGFNSHLIYKKFYQKILKHKRDLKNLLTKLKGSNKKVIGYGASTKGNVILQFCKINSSLLNCIYDINKDKNNKYTPGSKIKILDKKNIDKINFDFFLVLPWHFKDFILKKERNYISKNIKFIFPLPKLQIL
jgi:hypothetical protein